MKTEEDLIDEFIKHCDAADRKYQWNAMLVLTTAVFSVVPEQTAGTVQLVPVRDPSPLGWIPTGATVLVVSWFIAIRPEHAGRDEWAYLVRDPVGRRYGVAWQDGLRVLEQQPLDTTSAMYGIHDN